ncbi:hypothetical protein PENTCL1PPCAC_21021, partial [Pristionchus entomophagus]
SQSCVRHSLSPFSVLFPPMLPGRSGSRLFLKRRVLPLVVTVECALPIRERAQREPASALALLSGTRNAERRCAHLLVEVQEPAAPDTSRAYCRQLPETPNSECS